MKTLKSIEDRIVNLQKITSDGETSEVEAELRHLDLVGMIPNQIKVVLAREFGVSLTMDWDNSNTWSLYFLYTSGSTKKKLMDHSPNSIHGAGHPQGKPAYIRNIAPD